MLLLSSLGIDLARNYSVVIQFLDCISIAIFNYETPDLQGERSSIVFSVSIGADH